MKTTIIFIFISVFTFSQTSKSVLFLGNSYTQYNNLPNLVASIATSNGNTLIHSSNTPGGFTLEGHSTNTTSLNLIAQGEWDHVVIQEQSQLPSFPWQQFHNSTVPFAKLLCDTIRYADSCTEPIFFNTWGRLNGDLQWDSINTFHEEYLDRDTLKDAVILVNREEYAKKKAAEDGDTSFEELVGYTGPYNYVFTYINGSNKIHQAPPVGSSAEYPLTVNFESISNPSQKDFFVEYRVKSSVNISEAFS